MHVPAASNLPSNKATGNRAATAIVKKFIGRRTGTSYCSMKIRIRQYLLLIMLLALIAEVLSIVSLVHYVQLNFGLRTTPSFCNISARLNCDAVTKSSYSTLLGIPIATYGALFYLAIILVASSCLKLGGKINEQKTAAVIFVMGVFACLFSVYLFAVSQWLIRVLCPTCIGMYVCNIGILALSAVLVRKDFFRNALEGVVEMWRFPSFLISGRGDALYIAMARKAVIVTVIFGGILLAAPLFVVRYGTVKIGGDMFQDVQKTARMWNQGKAEPLQLVPDGPNRDYMDGPADAPVNIVAFSDLECPACHAFHSDIRGILQDLDVRVRLVFKNFPLDRSCNSSLEGEIHKNACFLAALARCAGEQGRFWETIDYLMAIREFGPPSARDSIISDASRNNGLNEGVLKECVASGRQLPKIRSDVAEGVALGIAGTPSVYVNGKKLPLLERTAMRKIIIDAASK